MHCPTEKISLESMRTALKGSKRGRNKARELEECSNRGRKKARKLEQVLQDSSMPAGMGVGTMADAVVFTPDGFSASSPVSCERRKENRSVPPVSIHPHSFTVQIRRQRAQRNNGVGSKSNRFPVAFDIPPS